MAALLAQLEGSAARQPVFMIFEDVHWMDPTSLELLALQWSTCRSFAYWW